MLPSGAAATSLLRLHTVGSSPDTPDNHGRPAESSQMFFALNFARTWFSVVFILVSPLSFIAESLCFFVLRLLLTYFSYSKEVILFYKRIAACCLFLRTAFGFTPHPDRDIGDSEQPMNILLRQAD